MADLRFAIVTCSDTRSIEQDTAGAALEQLIADNGWECASRVIVKDERADIAAAIVEACDTIDADIVLTCGGSGLSLRDVTPEATQDVCERNVPGIAEAMRAHSLAITPFAMLSRALCMQRGRHIVINLPGSEKAARENWDGIVAALPHAAEGQAAAGQVNHRIVDAAAAKGYGLQNLFFVPAAAGKEIQGQGLFPAVDHRNDFVDFFNDVLT